jgi:hypothetical protein
MIVPKTADGLPISSPTWEDTGGLSPKWTGHKYTAVADAFNIFDHEVLVEQRIRGGWYELLDANASMDDVIEFSVVDKNDVLGLFGALGLTVGVDVLELNKYVASEIVNPQTAGIRQGFLANSTALVFPGLFLRTAYDAAPGTNRVLKVVYLAYE